jgi:hypothetical protein
MNRRAVLAGASSLLLMHPVDVYKSSNHASTVGRCRNRWVGTAKSKYLTSSCRVTSLGGSTKKETSKSGKGASPKVNMDEDGGNFKVWYTLLCTRSRNDTPEAGPT